jgi:hypothetical protein
MGELGALFNPGMRHELEERQAKAARREEEGNARDGDLRIDLESGVAVINVPGSDEDTDGSTDNSNAGSDQAKAERATDDRATVDQVAADQGADAGKPEPPVLRPRGKRGMSTANR